MRKTVFAFLLLFLFPLLFFSYPIAGFELPAPDHGVEEDFDKLWSKYEYDAPDEDGTPVEYLTRSSDYFYAEPPEAPQQWNRGETGRFDGGGANESVRPVDADTRDGDRISDAYVEVFAVSPSTLVHYTSDEKVLYAQDDGEVHAFVDYEATNVDDHFVEVEVVETRDTVSETGGVTIDYDRLGFADESLTVRAEVTAEWDEGNDTETETVVVEDSVDVEPYNVSSPSAIALRNTYPDGDEALFLLRGGPWSSVTVGNGTTVHSNWRFFSARDTDWDGGTTDGEGYHPLQVHAYPSSSGVYVDGEAEVGAKIGDTYEPPEMPDGVNVDLPDTEYNATEAVALRYDGPRDVSVSGIVGNRTGGADSPPVPVERIRGTELSMSVVEVRGNEVEVEVFLQDDEGNPIYTRGADGGYVRLEGREEVETRLDGTATVNVSPVPSGAVMAEYVPPDWYDAVDERRGGTPYVGDSATLVIEDGYDFIDELGMLAQVVVFVLPVLILVFFIDRAFGLGIWPPWRKI